MFKGIAGGGHYNRDGNGANTLSPTQSGPSYDRFFNSSK